MKVAMIFEAGGQIVVHASSKTTAGLWISSEPVLQAWASNAKSVGTAVLQCLTASASGIPHPKSFKNLFDPVLAVAGVKSHRAFMSGRKCVKAQMNGDELILVPMRNEGPKEGFSPLSDGYPVAWHSEETLGSAVLSALAVAQ
jgi:hypothetical protein